MKTTLPVDDIAGTAQQCKGMLGKYKDDMTTKGVDPTNLVTKLDGDCATMVASDAAQEQTKTALREHTDKVQQDKTIHLVLRRTV